MRLEVVGALLAMLAPFIFHWLLLTELRMRYIVLIMSGIAILSLLLTIDFPAINNNGTGQ